MSKRKQKKYQITPDKFLSEDEFHRLHRSCRKHIKKQMALFIITALRTGARASEIRLLTRASLGDKVTVIGGEKFNTVLVKGTKNSSDREIPIPLWLHDELMERSPEVGAIFPIGRFSIINAWKDYTPNRYKTFHSTRHTFAIRFYMATKDVHLLRHALGHREIANTLVYLDFVHSLEDMGKAVAKIG